MEKDMKHLKEDMIHGTFFLPFEYYPCTIPESFTILPIHWHEEMELTLITKGSCLYNIDLAAVSVKKDDLIILAPHQLHGVSQIKKQTMASESFVFSLNILGFGFLDTCSSKYLHPLANHSLDFVSIIKPKDYNYPQLKECFLNIKKCYMMKESGFELLLKSELFRFFYILLKDIKNTQTPVLTENAYAMEKIRQIILYIQANYKKQIAISELAELCHFSPYHLIRFFKKFTGMTCVDYMNQYRLSKALEQLEHTSLPITQIALENGFNTISYFNRLFKTNFHMTPNEYRRLKKKPS